MNEEIVDPNRPQILVGCVHCYGIRGGSLSEDEYREFDRKLEAGEIQIKSK
jgi:hypothetical protein